MLITLTNKELVALVKADVSNTIGIAEDRLKVALTKKGSSTEASVEVLAPGEAHSPIEAITDAPSEPTTNDTNESVSYIN